MIEVAMWVVVAGSCIGSALNINKRRAGFGVWILTNAAWVAYDLHKGAYPQAALFVIYTALAVWGRLAWKTPNYS